MSTIDGLTIEERGGPEGPCACDMSVSHYEGCACHESSWAARLAAAEANYARECASHDKTCELMNDALAETVQTVAALEKAVDRALAAEAEVERLRAAGIEFASQYGNESLTCVFDNSCDDSGREPRCVPCVFRAALAKGEDR